VQDWCSGREPLAPTDRSRLAHVNFDTVRSLLRKILEAIVLTLMVTLALIVVVGVGFRKAGASLVWYDEVASVVLAWLTYYGAALAALSRSHIGMPTLVDRLPGNARKAVVIFGDLVVITFFSAVAWAGVRVLSVLGGSTLVSLPWVPLAVTQSVMPIGAVLFIAAQLLSLPSALRASEAEEDA
jgi:TRAP-type C4-dicarboxylate transport system permease small subunit